VLWAYGSPGQVPIAPALGGRGISLMLVETGEVEGFRRGRNLEKIGFEAQDTSELFFDDVRVPAGNLLGSEPNRGFVQLMEQPPQERLIIAVQAVGAMELAVRITTEYVKEPKAFENSLFDFRNTRFKLAEAATEA